MEVNITVNFNVQVYSTTIAEEKWEGIGTPPFNCLCLGIQNLTVFLFLVVLALTVHYLFRRAEMNLLCVYINIYHKGKNE